MLSPLLLVLTALLPAGPTAAADWVEGRHYFVISPVQPTQVAPGKIEVVEVFSYGCPACNTFYPTMEKIKAALPANAEVRFLPASWIAAESWPLFQRAYLTAEALGVADKAHGAMFQAIWSNGELTIVERGTDRLKQPPPTLEQVAAFYQRTTGVAADKFIQAAKSFAVESRIKNADKLIKAYRVESTPTLVINGKYRVTGRSAGGVDEFVELTRWLVERESSPDKAP
ncbi:MAG: thiol:disulfide interchange protein DsbA/DsbL [Gammaproteobacteria bacterium]|nr:thiol:disulfide interchange protein DsbA/DsbL [Gammaproteobacteria bacterium]